jgi:hypothetical protein
MQWKELTYAEAESGAKIWAKAGAEKRRERERTAWVVDESRSREQQRMSSEQRIAESVAGERESRRWEPAQRTERESVAEEREGGK